ncbi:DUF4249 domain-containing protein [Saprospiraceae bacterium]|nr:DUF4249 domain-containing protein [Saprospiraceae bacterium]MDC3210768.1 DUF4249 domain-containing protein [Saprospiraceae bacterium]
MKNIPFILLLAILLSSCVEENLNNIAENQFVIEAFLYAGEPIDDIRIKTTYDLSSEEDVSVPINNAIVTLIKNGERYNLISSGDDGFYNYPGNDVTVETYDIFQLEVSYNGISAMAETIVPTPTIGLSISEDSLFVPILPITAGMDSIVNTIRNFLTNSVINATWDNPNEDLYFMVVESVSDTLDPIFPTQVIDVLARFRFVSEPTDGTSISFIAGTLESFGTYSVKVYHINQEYADLYENREQDSRDLNEPPSNITNALGVFSAFNSQEVFFEVARE